MKKVPIYYCLFAFLMISCGQNAKTSIDSSGQKNNFERDIKYITINMTTIPATDDPLVLRTDFSNENEWKTICNEILTPNPELGFLPNVVFASDSSFQNFSEEQLLSDSTSKYNHAFIFLVDNITMANPEHPVLCIGLQYNKGMKFRTVPSEMWGIENNLSISNMDFEEFSQAVDEDGIFRGFK